MGACLGSGTLRKEEALNRTGQMFNQALTFHRIQDSLSQTARGIGTPPTFCNATHKDPNVSFLTQTHQCLDYSTSPHTGPAAQA